MIDLNHGLSLTQQAKSLGFSRSSVYYLPHPISEHDQTLMKRMDRLHLDYPFAGARMLRDMLRLEGFTVGRTPSVRSCVKWALKPCIVSPEPQNAIQGIRYIPIYYDIYRSRSRIRYGPWILPISPWRVGLCRRWPRENDNSPKSRNARWSDPPFGGVRGHHCRAVWCEAHRVIQRESGAFSRNSNSGSGAPTPQKEITNFNPQSRIPHGCAYRRSGSGADYPDA